MTYLISDEVPESDLNKITGKVSGLITELGGKVTKEDIWGRRKLAYPIKKQEFATYVTVYFNLAGSKLLEFDKDVRLLTGVLRHLTLVKDFGTEGLVLTTEDIAETEEIKEVLGGEKSFEAVEGQTEESLDLMAKREKEEEVTEEEVPAAKEKEEVAKEEVAPVAEEKPAKEAKVQEAEVQEEKTTETEEAAPVVEEKTEEKKPKAKKAEKKSEKESPDAKAMEDKEKVQEEVDRLSKLNDELDDILKDEL